MTRNSSIDTQWAARFADLLGGEGPVPEGGTSAAAASLQDTPELLTPLEMARADQLTVAAGTASLALMESAGHAVAAAVRSHLPSGSHVTVMTGPGNNGGDGFVAARVLAEAGYAVSVAMTTARDRLKGDAAFAAASWTGFSKGLSPAVAGEADVIVDAIFGAGLDRQVEGVVAQTIEAVNASGVPVISVDLPSGINGRDGRVMGTAIRARESVTFFRRKPGHLLMPGREYAGNVIVADIGIPAEVLDTIRPAAWHNTPRLWSLPPLAAAGHKYTRGHVLVVSGPLHRTGAARLAARGALRAGAGLVTVASPVEALAANAAHLTAIMLLPMEGANGLRVALTDERKNVVVMGPALGLDEGTVELVEIALASHAAVVLDADALTSFAGALDRLVGQIRSRSAPVVLTPHEGEFTRLFPDLALNGSKLERARLAAELTGAVVVLKGPDTVVASPLGFATISDNAPPQLATAGSGDVLAGVIGGLLAQGMGAFEAATAAVWLHGEAGRVKGRGLIAEDVPEALPAVFAELSDGPD